MARVVVSSYLVRFPLGGYFSWVLHWLIGFQRLGHEVYYVEKSGWQDSCYHPWRDVASEDCTYGTATLNMALARYGLERNWCFLDGQGRYHGLSREQVAVLFRSADLYLDMGMHEWLEEATLANLRVVVDGEPAYTQMQWEEGLTEGKTLPAYDHYFTVGRNIGTDCTTAPTAGKHWRPIFDPINVDLIPFRPPRADAPFTTVMSWQAHEPIQYGGKTYGQKDVEFEKFFDLPGRIKAPLEIAVGGAGRDNVPARRLRQAGWRVRNSLTVSRTYELFMNYIQNSKGEFSVCKNVFVATNSGFFSERSAAYLASGRPVVMQDTGFSAHLPCGQGLFAVHTVDEAAAAIEEINRDNQRQSRWARELAFEYLDTAKVLGGLLADLGL